MCVFKVVVKRSGGKGGESRCHLLAFEPLIVSGMASAWIVNAAQSIAQRGWSAHVMPNKGYSCLRTKIGRLFWKSHKEPIKSMVFVLFERLW